MFFNDQSCKVMLYFSLSKPFGTVVGNPFDLILQNYIFFIGIQFPQVFFFKVVVIIGIIPYVMLDWYMCSKIKVGGGIEDSLG